MEAIQGQVNTSKNTGLPLLPTPLVAKQGLLLIVVRMLAALDLVLIT